MKSYIQDFCGDEDSVVIDLAILQCMLQEVIFEKLVGKPMIKTKMSVIVGLIL